MKKKENNYVKITRSAQRLWGNIGVSLLVRLSVSFGGFQMITPEWLHILKLFLEHRCNIIRYMSMVMGLVGSRSPSPKIEKQFPWCNL